VAVHIEPRTLDRQAALRAAQGERSLLHRSERALRDAVERAVLRTLRFAVGGAAAVAASSPSCCWRAASAAGA
jgi:hypothetical protein